MTIDLRDIANITIIIFSVFSSTVMIRLAWQSRKQDKEMDRLMAEMQRDHLEFIRSVKMKRTKPELSVVERKDKE